ncbi:hypothetical protein HZA96_06940 [Candidatus Woesearchaeota archaeon]|nr:hypothetical protein [Candidatus Woesearchaeota archaeon]
MNQDEHLYKLEGLHTIETAAEKLNITRQSALNLLVKLKKQEYATVQGAGRKKRLYTISMRKQRKRDIGMFDIINKYSPHMKINPWYDHQVHGVYTVEDALIDAIETKSFRIILASLHLFKHIKDWPKLYKLAKEKSSWQKVGALYDVARMFMKIRKMPERYRGSKWKTLSCLIPPYETKEKEFYSIRDKWKINIPFRFGDLGDTMPWLTFKNKQTYSN